MTDTFLILILEAAIIITSGLVLYCLHVINGLRAKNKILDADIADNGKEIEYLQGSVGLGNKSGENLVAIEESFAKYRGQTKVMMQKMKLQDKEINRLQDKLKKVNAQNSVIVMQLQSVLKQSPNLVKDIKAPLEEASKQHTQEQKMVTELKNHKVRLEAKTKVLEQRLKQTVVEKEFIEQRYVEFAEAEDLPQAENLGPMENGMKYQSRSNTTVQ